MVFMNPTAARLKAEESKADGWRQAGRCDLAVLALRLGVGTMPRQL